MVAFFEHCGVEIPRKTLVACDDNQKQTRNDARGKKRMCNIANAFPHAIENGKCVKRVRSRHERALLAFTHLDRGDRLHRARYLVRFPHRDDFLFYRL